MGKTLNHVRRGSAIVVAGLAVSLLAGCSGDDDGSGTSDPLIEEGSNVIPSGTGPGTDPVPPADSTIIGADSRGPGSPVGDSEGVQGGVGQDTAR